MARIRRSARLASATKSSASASTTSLGRVAEGDESPSPKDQDPRRNDKSSNRPVPSSPAPQTPATSSPVKPPMSEMHPGKFHNTMAPPSSALHLGFADIKKPSDKDFRSSPTPALAGRTAAPAPFATPSAKSAVPPSSPFTFRVASPTGDRTVATSGLSARAQQMMDEIREDAMRIKADLVARREQESLEEAENNGRKIAKAKGKAGRFSSVHMAEFKKMDSIENHPAALRAQQQQQAAATVAAKFATPLSRGVKRTQSKANLADPESARSAASGIPASSATARGGPASAAKKPNLLFPDAGPSSVKRVRQNLEDDASSNRPVSRDASFIPRPTTAGKDSATAASVPRSHTNSNLAALMTPTKASLAKSALPKTQTGGSMRLAATGSLKKSATTSNLVTEQKEAAPVRTPGRFDRVKSILKGHRFGSAAKPKSALPMPSAAAGLLSKTPSALSLDKPLPAVPATTPSRKLIKRVVFTPDAKKATVALVSQNSPSPLKSGIPRSKTFANLADVRYPNLDSANGKGVDDGGVTYPDLSASLSKDDNPAAGPSEETVTEDAKDAPAPTVPGTFTFRSDHTIRFDSTSPTGFGGTRGQSSVRHVRPSIMPAHLGLMPGSFPSSIAEFGGISSGSSSGSSRGNKENRNPQILLPAVKHGLENKKRHRASADPEDGEGEPAERAAKKRRHEPAPEGEAILAPRAGTSASSGSVFASTARRSLFSPSRRTPAKPSQIPGIGTQSPSPIKRSAKLSLSRLNMLARPKVRR
ncbi:hypothetical protein RB600_000358 [Gaeumannomyces tritici]